MLWNVLVLQLSLLLNSMPLYGYIIFCLSIHPLMDIWDISTFWLLQILLLWTLSYVLCGQMFSFLSGRYIVVELLDHMVIAPNCMSLLLDSQFYSFYLYICIYIYQTIYMQFNINFKINIKGIWMNEMNIQLP